MDEDQDNICRFLKSWPGQFVSRKEIARRAGGKRRYREDANWVAPVLQRMLEMNLVEKDGTGGFRLVEQKSHHKKNNKKMWVSPAMKAILKQSGRNFAVIDLDQEVDPADLAKGTGQSHPGKTENRS